MAAAVAPDARELNSFLLSVATEVDSAVDLLLHELDQRADAARGAPIEPPKDNSDWLRLSRIGAPRETDVTKTNGSAPSSAVVGWALRHKPLVAIALVGLTAGRKVIGSRDLVGMPLHLAPNPLNRGPRALPTRPMNSRRLICLLQREISKNTSGPRWVIRVGLTLSPLLPVYPNERTSRDRPGWSVLCQKGLMHRNMVARAEMRAY